MNTSERASERVDLTLVLLPGMDGTGLLFHPFIEALGGRLEVQVVAYPCDRPLGYQALTDLVRDALPRRGRFVIVGESFSGPVAISLAAEAPDGLVGLVLCCSFARNPSSTLASIARLIPMLPIKALPPGWLAPKLLGRYGSESLKVAFVDAMRRVSGATLRARLSAIAAVNVSAAARRIRLPVLYLRASHDQLVLPQSSLQLQKLIPSMRLAEFKSPHFLLQTFPHEAAVVLERFVSDT